MSKLNKLPSNSNLKSSLVGPPTISRFNKRPSISNISNNPFEINTHVKVDSLNIDGYLRFYGAVDFKTGLWAGIELSPLHHGKGKNNGSVNGKRYFTCDQNNGIFVPSSKVTLARSPSVASSCRSPSPSQSSQSGRFTPFNSRISRSNTPTSTSTVRKPRASTLNIKSQEAEELESKITTGTRASKYLGLKASQLRSTPQSSKSSIPSPSVKSTPKFQSRISVPSSATPKPSRHSYGEIPTPRKLGSNRPSLASLKSNDNMPPPSSPTRRIMSQQSTTTPKKVSSLERSSSSISNTSTDFDNLQANQRSIDDKIAKLTNNNNDNNNFELNHERSSSVSSHRTPSRASSERPSSRFSDRNLTRSSLSHRKSYSRNDIYDEFVTDSLAQPSFDVTSTSLINNYNILQEKFDQNSKEKSTIEVNYNQVKNELEQLIEKHKSVQAELDQSKLDMKNNLEESKNLNLKIIKDKDSEIDRLNEEINKINNLLNEVKIEFNNTKESNNEEINSLKSNIESLIKSSEESTRGFNREREDLNNLINELREAGQETIALYEERINNTESRRFEIEEKVKFLENEHTKLLTQLNEPASPTTAAKRVTTAAEIDNESLREQLAHLQNKLTNSEENLTEIEKERELADESYKNNINKSEAYIKELTNKFNELDNDYKLLQNDELNYKNKCEELEEALKDNKECLEATRAEIETLRSDIENYENLQPNSTSINDNERVNELYKRLEVEQNDHLNEIDEIRSNYQNLEEKLIDSENVSKVYKRECDLVKAELKRYENERKDVSIFYYLGYKSY